MFLTSLKQTCNEYLIRFSENQSAPKLENRKTSPCSPCAPNLLHVLVSRIPGYHNLCSPVLYLSALPVASLAVKDLLPRYTFSQFMSLFSYIFSVCEFIFISNQYYSQPYMMGYTVCLPILVLPSQTFSNPGLDVKLGRLFLSPYCHYLCPSTSQGGPVCVIIFVYYASVFVRVCIYFVSSYLSFLSGHVSPMA